VYPRYDALDSAYQFPKVIHAKVDTAASGFLETRALTACSLIEHLVTVYSRDHGLRPPLDKSLFRSELPRLKEQLDDLLLHVLGDALCDSDRDEMSDRAQWFNDPTFARKLRFLADGLGLPVGDDDLRNIRNTRNALVHRMRFHADAAGKWPHRVDAPRSLSWCHAPPAARVPWAVR
jgi:hypothetical protein